MFNVIRKNTNFLIWTIAITFVITIFISWGMNFTGKAMMPHLAIVAGKKITTDEFQQAYETKYKNIKDAYGKDFDPESIPDLRKQVLDSLVKEKILLAETKRYGITVTEDEIVNGVRSSFPDINTYNQYIKYAPPIWWKTKEQDVSKEIMMAKLIGAMVDHSTITDGEIDSYYKREYEQAHLLHILISPKKLVPQTEVADYYEKNKEDFMKNGKLKARHILIAVQENANQQEDGAAKAKITNLYNQAKGGGDFAELAKKNSNCPSSQNGGLLDYFGEGVMDPEFEKAAYKLKVGELSPPVRSKFGYHIIKLEDKLPDTPKALEDVEEEIRGIALTNEITKKTAKEAKRIQKMLKQGQISFEEAARLYSHGTISSKTAGDIGIIPKRFISEDIGTATVAAWKEELGVYNNEIDGQIASAAFVLKPGEITSVIENHLGYHIIKMVGKIPADIAKFETIKKDVITKSLAEKKSKTYQDWYDGLKKKAKAVIAENVL
ncbi:peptidylprolyl isomerase [bacterium]|nr:peptidylprolyl isomerase [bacterium]MBU1753931.1 peptidylprolyl isomerase [bacterium]